MGSRTPHSIQILHCEPRLSKHLTLLGTVLQARNAFRDFDRDNELQTAPVRRSQRSLWKA
jgi:hypothetical protein